MILYIWDIGKAKSVKHILDQTIDHLRYPTLLFEKHIHIQL